MSRQEAPRILLINHDLFFSGRICGALEKAGYAVEIAADMEKAIERCALHPPALALVNLASLPAEAADSIRRLKAECHVPRILAFLSHVRISAVRESVLAAGADRLCANSAISLRLLDLVRWTLEGKGEAVIMEEDS